jgi:hypothetical protein
LLRHARPGGDNDALTGDLIERFRDGQTRGWFWRQVLIAIAVGVLGGIRRHWPYFCYAIAGTAMPAILWKSISNAAGPHPLGFWLHWWTLPWPLSQLVLDLSPPALLALAALPALAAALVINRSFRWISLLRTGVINLALITLDYYLFELLRPWLTRSVPGHPYHYVFVVPWVLQMLGAFSVFLVSAWLGCRPSRGKQPSGLPKTA